MIAFGGRALAADVQPKYLNSPETPLFHKGEVLYNLDKARKFAADRSRIIAVEGYMDVIAMCRGGFPETVAPLGTALTAMQLALLWRIAPEPVLCFDGDKAGMRRRPPRGRPGAAAACPRSVAENRPAARGTGSRRPAACRRRAGSSPPPSRLPNPCPRCCGDAPLMPMTV